MTDITNSDLLRMPDIDDQNEDENVTRVYTKEERNIINSFKDKYMAATSPSERRTIAQLEMLPKLFNYWKDRGITYNTKLRKTKTNVC